MRLCQDRQWESLLDKKACHGLWWYTNIGMLLNLEIMLILQRIVPYDSRRLIRLLGLHGLSCRALESLISVHH